MSKPALPAFDTHAHLTDRRFRDDLDEVLQGCKRRGMAGVIAVGTTAPDSKASLKLARANRGFVWATAGVHPLYLKKGWSERALSEIEALLEEPEVVAVGEIGLDYHRERVPRGIQEGPFRAQLGLAERNALPAVVHVRAAWDEALGILADYDLEGVILHCFSGDVGELETADRRGYYVSFAGNLCYDEERAARLLPLVPPERLLFETDCPWLSPVRAKRAVPSDVLTTLMFAAGLLGVEADRLARGTTASALGVLGIDGQQRNP